MREYVRYCELTGRRLCVECCNEFRGIINYTLLNFFINLQEEDIYITRSRLTIQIQQLIYNQSNRPCSHVHKITV